jgi:hypothetical protein
MNGLSGDTDMRIRKPKDLPKRFHDIGDEFASHPLGSVVAFTVLGLFIAIPFLFLFYPGWIAYEYLKAEQWPETMAVAAVAFSTAIAFLIVWLSSIGRVAYLLTLTGTLGYLVFNGTLSDYGTLFAILSCAAIAVVGATVVLLVLGLRA